jgi:hypothetical protein
MFTHFISLLNAFSSSITILRFRYFVHLFQFLFIFLFRFLLFFLLFIFLIFFLIYIFQMPILFLFFLSSPSYYFISYVFFLSFSFCFFLPSTLRPVQVCVKDLTPTLTELTQLLPNEISALKQSNDCVRFEVFMAVTMKNVVFWYVTPCGSCKNRSFGGT